MRACASVCIYCTYIHVCIYTSFYGDIFEHTQVYAHLPRRHFSESTFSKAQEFPPRHKKSPPSPHRKNASIHTIFKHSLANASNDKKRAVCVALGQNTKIHACTTLNKRPCRNPSSTFQVSWRFFTLCATACLGPPSKVATCRRAQT